MMNNNQSPDPSLVVAVAVFARVLCVRKLATTVRICPLSRLHERGVFRTVYSLLSTFRVKQHATSKCDGISLMMRTRNADRYCP